MIETRSTADLESALARAACPIVVIDLGRRPRAGLEELRRRGVRGKDVTPFLLDRFATETKGESLRINRLIILNNARVAARIAGAHTALAAEWS